MGDNKYMIYQIEDTRDNRDIMFEPLAGLRAQGLYVDRRNYEHVYTGDIEHNDLSSRTILEMLFMKFNDAHPADFPGRSMSIGDVVVLRRDGTLGAYFCDDYRFQETDRFLAGPYYYYSTQRPIDIGTFPKFANEPVSIDSFDSRIAVENGLCRAWGVLTYTMPLTQKQIDGYELRAASTNPDYTGIAPKQLEAQLEVVGKWERAHHVPDIRRLTWFYSDFGVFIKNDGVTREQVANHYGHIVETKARAAEKRAAKKPISEQLREGAELAAKDNAVRPVPPRDKGIER